RVGPAAPAPPQPRAGDDRPDQRAEGQPTHEARHLPFGRVYRRDRPSGSLHAPLRAGPRTATADEIAMPTQAMTDAATRWKSPIDRRSMPSRSPSAFPAQAPRIAATRMIGRRPPAVPRIRTYSEA